MLCDLVDEIRFKIQRALAASARPDKKIALVAVSKTVPSETLRQALRCGVGDFGENKIQEAEPKFAELSSENFRKHFIGHLQSNKAKRAVEIFDLIQSVDSLELLKKIDAAAKNFSKMQNCLVEIKLSTEPSKFGLDPQNLESFLENAAKLERVRVLGLMAMAPHFDDAQLTRPYFAKARQHFDQFFKSSEAILSMGMSTDFEVAIQEGSTMVSIGTALFGSRASHL